MACLNGARTIAEQLDALAGQVCPVEWELLLCDNGSTDDTVRIAERFADRLPIFVVDASGRRGAGAARNHGAALARGQWLAFCDADDVVAGDWLGRMVAHLREHDFVAGRFEATRLNGRRALRSRDLDQQQGLQTSPELTDLPHAGAGNMGIRRAVFQRVGGFDITMSCLEDTDLSWRVQLEAGTPLHYAPDVLVHVRLRSSPTGIYRQGFDYGVAHAELESRYRGRLRTRTRGTGRVRVGRALAACTAMLTGGRRPSLGRALWQLGWHRGYHRGGTAHRVRRAWLCPARRG